MGWHNNELDQIMIRQLQPILRRIGVSRVNDISKYDDLPICVVQAIRPRAKHIKVDSGKGFTFEQGYISAAVEAIERYVAENISNTVYSVSLCELPLDLKRAYFSSNHYPSSINAVKGYCLITNRVCFIPLDMCTYDLFDVLQTMPCVANGTTGLGAHTSLELSRLSGILEILERSAIANNKIQSFMLPQSPLIFQQLSAILDKVASIQINSYQSIPSLSVVEVRCSEQSVNGGFTAFGTGFNLTSALQDALSEAMQTWIMRIAASRDDWSYSLTPYLPACNHSYLIKKSNLNSLFNDVLSVDEEQSISKYHLDIYYQLLNYFKANQTNIYSVELKASVNVKPVVVSKVIIPGFSRLRQGPMLTGYPILPV